MKTIKLVLVVVSIFLTTQVFSQSAIDPADFHGATADLKAYKALYIINQSDDKKIKAVLRNISNAMEDPRLKGKLQVELVAFGDGVDVFKKSGHYDTLLISLQKKGLLLAQCENTVRERKISKDELLPFISYVPSGMCVKFFIAPTSFSILWLASCMSLTMLSVTRLLFIQFNTGDRYSGGAISKTRS